MRPSLLACCLAACGAAAPPAAIVSIQSVIDQNKPAIAACRAEAVARNPGVAGTVTLSWAIVDGHAADVRVVSDDTQDAGLAACVTAKVEGWSFAGVKDGHLKNAFVFQKAR